MNKDKTKVKKKKHIVRNTVIGIILIFISVLIVFSVHCKRLMNKNAAEGLEILEQYYTVTECPETEFSSMRFFGIMKFETTQYDVEDLGNLCIMKSHIGPMQMATFVLTPYEKQMPMLTTDFMYTLTNRKVYVECYDLVSDTDTDEYQSILGDMEDMLGSFSDLEEFEGHEGWYQSLIEVAHRKKGNSSQEERFRQLFTESVKTYAEISTTLDPLSDEERIEKAEITDTYCRNMVENGGFSTNIFKKALGGDKTLEFYRTVFFGPADYMD